MEPPEFMLHVPGQGFPFSMIERELLQIDGGGEELAVQRGSSCAAVALRRFERLWSLISALRGVSEWRALNQ